MKKLHLFLLILIICFSITACSSKPADKLTQVTQAKELKVLVAENSKPYSFYNDVLKEYQGVEILIAQQVASDIGVKLVTVPVPKAKLISSLSQGDIAIGRIANYESLRNNYTVSNPYANGELYVATPRGMFFPTIGAFDSKAVGVSDQLSEPAQIIVNSANNVKIQNMSDLQAVVNALLDKSIIGYFCYKEQAMSLIKNKDIQVQSLLNTTPENYVVVADKNSYSLMAQVNKTISHLIEDGSIDKFYKQFSES